MSPNDTNSVRGVRLLIERTRAELAALEARLAELLAEAGRRPGDGSDQPGLFESARQPSLFGG